MKQSFPVRSLLFDVYIETHASLLLGGLRLAKDGNNGLVRQENQLLSFLLTFIESEVLSLRTSIFCILVIIIGIIGIGVFLVSLLLFDFLAFTLLIIWFQIVTHKYLSLKPVDIWYGIEVLTHSHCLVEERWPIEETSWEITVRFGSFLENFITTSLLLFCLIC